MELKISPAQLRAARALLGWTRERLAQRCGVAPRTLARLEHSPRRPRKRTLAAIVKAFQAGGLEFLGEKDGGPGVTIRRDAPAVGKPAPRVIRVQTIRIDDDRVTVELFDGRNLTLAFD